MQFSTTIFSAAILLMASQAMGAALDVPNDIEAREINIATSPHYACNCPRNCSHKEGSSCKFYGGPSDDTDVVKGKCTKIEGHLSCV